MTPEMKAAHQVVVQVKIIDELQALITKYDAKELAILMFYQSCQLFRAVHSLGMWTVEDIEVFTREAQKDMLTPLPADKLPKQAIIDENGVLNPGTSQTIN